MLRIASRALAGSCLVLALCAASQATPVTAPVLDIYGTKLTVDPTSFSSHQPCHPRFDQRGVDIDGTARLGVPMGWSVAADALSGGYSTGRTLGDVQLATGGYNPTEVDLVLPSIGLPVVIGRTYNGVQSNGSGGYASYDGYQGWNWNQMAQPHISLVTGATNDLDVIYLFYGNDRFIEFKRSALNSDEFKAKNGAAGVIHFDPWDIINQIPGTYTYTDPRGNSVVFFDYSTDAAHGAGHLWKMVDAAGHVTYVEDASDAAAAAANGYDSSDRVKNMYDASGRKYVFTYNTYGSSPRLQKVEAQINSGGWTTIAKVEYDYYTSTSSGEGLEGDLKLVTTTMKGVSGGDYVRTKYYRYYTNSTWANSDGSRGKEHLLKMAVGFEGLRKAESDLTITSHNFSGVSDSTLFPYAEGYFEYISNTDWRLKTALFNGNCGCAGGTSGTYTFSYTDGSTYATEIANTSYDTAWARRTVIAQPDGTYVSQYFDETGAPLSRVLTNTDPSGSPTKTWVTGVDRDSNGLVTTIHSPANNTGYTHSTGGLTYSTTVGLVTSYTRHSASDNLDGLRESVTVKEGTSGSATTTSSASFTERQLLVGSSAISIPEMASTSTYPDYSTALSTTYSFTYWSGTNTNVQYLAPKTVTVSNPAVTNNGSGSATTSTQYLRPDGSTAFSKDAGGIIFYSGRNTYGQTDTQVADCSTGSGDIHTSSTPDDDTASGWSLSSSGSPIHAKSSMTYDDQGRMLTSTQPSVNGTRTSASVYINESGKLTTISFPRKVSTTYYGPGSYVRVNHAGKPESRKLIKYAGGTTTPTTIPSSSDWSAQVDTVYDDSGMRAEESWTYTTSGTHDTAYTGYDAEGRRARMVDATGTITRMVFDERGLTTQKWVGTDDAGWTNPTGVGSSSNMVKVEELEYDGGSAGKNGYITTRSQDSTGAWSGGVGDRVTTFTNDYRGRAVVQANPVAPHTVTKYDNSNRATAVAQYSSTSGLSTSTDPTASSASTRVALSETFYDERGQVYQSKRWEIDLISTPGAKGSTQLADNWYDANGRLVKVFGTKLTKTFYDRLGRVTDRFDLAATNGDSGYSSAFSVSSNSAVIEQTHYALDPTSGRPLAQWLVQRAHTEDLGSWNGALDTNGDSDSLKLTFANLNPHCRPQITAMWYDDWDRVTDTVNYGTASGGSSFNRSGLSCPSSSATALRTSYAFDDFGRSSTVTDPAGVVSKTTYDYAGRRTASVDNYVNGHNPGDGTLKDENRTTEYTYVNGLVTKVKRRVSASSGDDQDTDYEYDTVSGVSSASVIKAKNILTRVVYPPQYTTLVLGVPTDQADTDRDVVYVYNALSQVSTTTDPAGNVITTHYDTGGRVSDREATTIAGGFDSRVTKIATTYNSRGMVDDVQQIGSGPTVRDEVAMDYDGWGNLSSLTQDPDSAFAGSGRASYAMTWTWAVNPTSNGLRLQYVTGWTQPDGTGPGMAFTPTFSYAFSTLMRRPAYVLDANSTVIADYQYLGNGTLVETGYSELTEYPIAVAYGQSSAADYDGCLDRFNRPTVGAWTYMSGANALSDFRMEYDLQGNVTTQTDEVMKNADATPKNVFDILNTYDALRRLQIRQEGKLSGGAITNQSRIENSLRNAAGRIVTDQVSLNSDNDYTDDFTNGPHNAIDAGEMDDARTYNKRNELISRTYGDATMGSPYTRTLVYDKNGNLTDDGEKYKYVYNPFGQLVTIKDQSSAVVANYTYNGLGQRISEQTDTNRSGNTGIPDGTVDGNDPIFFIAVDQQGRRVATYRGTDTYSKETFVYHIDGARGPHFQGGVLLRDRYSGLASTPSTWASASGNATRDERMYYASDYRGNVTAMVKSDSTIAEQYRYSSTGVPFGIPAGSVKGDGVVDGGTSGADYLLVDNLITNSLFEQRADLNLDGLVDSSDLTIVATNDGKVAGRGQFGGQSVGNRIGVRNCAINTETLEFAVINYDISMSTSKLADYRGDATLAMNQPGSESLDGCLGNCFDKYGRAVSRCARELADKVLICTQIYSPRVATDCITTNYLWYARFCFEPAQESLAKCSTRCWARQPTEPITTPNPDLGCMNADSKTGCLDCCLAQLNNDLRRAKTAFDAGVRQCGDFLTPGHHECELAWGQFYEEAIIRAHSRLLRCRSDCQGLRLQQEN